MFDFKDAKKLMRQLKETLFLQLWVVQWPWLLLWLLSLGVKLPVGTSPSLSPCQSENLWSWSVEFWSWGQTNRRTRRWSPQSNMPRWPPHPSPPSLWPYLEMWLLAHLRNSLPGGVRRVDPVCRVTTQLQHFFLKRCTKEAEGWRGLYLKKKKKKSHC